MKNQKSEIRRTEGYTGAHLGTATERSAAVPGPCKSRIFEHVEEYPCACTSDIAAPETGALRH
jgi:hypothetical protein